MQHVWKPIPSVKSTQEVACNINTSILNVVFQYSININVRKYSYTDAAYIYLIICIAYSLQCASDMVQLKMSIKFHDYASWSVEPVCLQRYDSMSPLG